MAAKYDYLLKRFRLKDGNGSTATAEALPMTTTERTAITPDAGVMIWDTDLEKLFIGDGSTAGGVEVEGGGGEGTVTGIEASVDGGTATITATGSTTSVKLTGTGGVDVRGNTTTGAVELDAKDLSDGTQSITKDAKETRWIPRPSGQTAPVPLTLMHFSDIHADTAALGRIMADRARLGDLVDEVICTGDMVNYSAGEIASWWAPSVLTCVGNHDTTTTTGGSDDDDGLSMADRIAYYISPFESNWGITRGDGVDWYYKDYSSQKVRLIVIDMMLYKSSDWATEAAAQNEWLYGLLDDAITNGLHVLIVSHTAYFDAKPVPCSFTRFGQGVTGNIYTIPEYLVNNVATKIASGLHFIGWMCGHLHYDAVFDALGDKKQYQIAIACACNNQWQQWRNTDLYRDATIDVYNLLTIDTTNTIVKIVRGGGANIDNKGRQRETICYNYTTGEIIDREIMAVQNGFRFNFDGAGNVARYIDTTTVTGSSITLQAGYAYKAIVTASLVLEAEVQPTSRSYGLDGLLDLTLAGGTVAAGANVYLADELTEGKRNICAVRYLDDLAVVNVLTVINVVPTGYVVSVSSGTDDGSLYYGLASSPSESVTFDASVDGQTISVVDATTNKAKTIVGNGVDTTTVTGSVSCAYPATFSALALNGATITGTDVALADVGLTGGTMTLDTGVTVPSSHVVDVSAGATVTVSGATVAGTLAVSSGGTMKVQSAVGDGVYDLGGFQNNEGVCTFSGAHLTGGTICNRLTTNGAYGINIQSSVISNVRMCNNSTTWAQAYNHIYLHGASVTNCTFDGNYGKLCIFNTPDATISGCIFSGNSATDRGICWMQKPATYKGCTFVSNYTSPNLQGMFLVMSGATATVQDCTFGVDQNINMIGAADVVVFAGSNATLSFVGLRRAGATTLVGSGHLVISSGAIVDLTGNTNATPIAPGGGVIVDGGCTVINSAGSSMSIASGTYTKINNDGTTA